MVETLTNRIRVLILLCAVISTLTITPWVSWDPINLGKLLVICSIAFSTLGIMTSHKYLRRTHLLSKDSIPFYFFALLLFFPIFLTNAPDSQQFWGVSGRSTGLLAYLSLCLVSLAAASVRTRNFESDIIRSLIFTGAILAGYGTLQVFKLDPIGWSQFAVFGTLGNVNFFASFTALVLIAIFTKVIFRPKSDSFVKTLPLISLFILLLWINLHTDSMQGPVTAIIGMLVSSVLFLWRRSKNKPWEFFGATSLILVSLSFPAVFGLFNKGPLRNILYQDSNVFRKDYMLAGWRMVLDHPLTGIGLDSYDNWYRYYGGFVAAYRTGPNRTSNSAHNVWLDIASGGGFPLFFGYIAIIGLAVFYSCKVIRDVDKINADYIALISCFIAYHFQSLLSINQIGLGIWGWVFSGALIGQSKLRLSEIKKSSNEFSAPARTRKRDVEKNAVKSLPPFAFLLSFASFSIGFLLAYFPFSSDAAFRRALNSQNLGEVVSSSNQLGSSGFQIAKAVQIAIQSGNSEVASNLTRDLTAKFPREIFGWDAVLRLPEFSDIEKREAEVKLKEIDPNFVCLDPDPIKMFKLKFLALSTSEKSELLAWWGLIPKSGANLSQINSAMASGGFDLKLRTICS